MGTIQETVEEIIHKTPFLTEALNDKLINVSSLARKIQPDVEKMLDKDVKEGAIMMAINRIPPTQHIKLQKNLKKFILDLGDFLVRSDLCDFTFKNSSSIPKAIAKIMSDVSDTSDYFFTVSQGIFESNIVASRNLTDKIESTFKEEKLICKASNLASITLRLPEGNLEQSGIYYFIMKQVAWADIPVQEVISTTHEMTLVVHESRINQTFAILMDVKKS